VAENVFAVGSVIEMKPERFRIKLITEEQSVRTETQAFGWGTVVINRDMWVMSTRIEPMVVCDMCSSLQPFETHWRLTHSANPSDSLAAWSMTG
jgi:hypothetical protein